MGKRLMILVVTLMATLAGPVTAQPADPSLMGWWKFDGDLLDSSGQSRHGAVVGIVPFDVGVLGQALALPGGANYVNVPGYKGILGNNPFSISAWINSTATGDATMVNWGTNSGGQRVDFRLYQSRLRIEHGNGNLQGGTNVANGEWHHIALTVDKGTAIQAPGVLLYVDGKDDTQTTTDPDTFNIVANVDVTFGRRATNNDRAFAGRLDEVRIYDRVLTPAEITALAIRPQAYNPVPANAGIGVTAPLFTWSPRQTAQWHDLYLGTSPDLGPDNLVGNHLLTPIYWHTPGLEPGMTYYWRVDEVELDGTVYPGATWSFEFASIKAFRPNPPDGEPYTDLDLTLTWMAGLNAVSHDIYFGTDKTAVTDGTGDTLKGNQFLATFPTGPLAQDTTYFWRIDEVNVAGGKRTGDVWSFKTLPEIAIVDPNLVGWWTLNEGSGLRAVDWSGYGHHGQFNTAARPAWVEGYDGTALAFSGTGQYLEATGYPGILGKKDRTTAAWIKTTQVGDIVAWGLQTDTQKWNFRVQDNNGNAGSIRVEVQGGRICGWKDVRDGEWHHVAAVLQSAGAPTCLDIKLYVDGLQEAISDSLTMDVNTVSGARNVRIGDGHQSRPFQGLIDDVRIYDKALTQEELDLVMRIDPLRAWRPYPATGSIVDIRVATPLTWEAGDGASKHDVYLGTDAAAVGAATTETADLYGGRISGTSYEPSADLEWGQTYFWRVDEVAADGGITPGSVWKFTVADYLIVDDFEGYTDEEEDSGKRIYQTWIDGWTNANGSTVGNWNPPFAERTIVHGGEQAMPMDYNNIDSPWYSEAERTWAKPQDWTLNDANTLVVYFRGQALSFAETADTITLSAAGWDIWHDAALTRFDEFRFVYKRLTGDGSIIARVDSLVNTNVWAKGGVMIRESLEWGSRHASVFITPGSGVAFQRRLADNDAGLSTAEAGVVAPRWVKLTRSGNTLTAQHSADGVTWVDVTNATGVSSDTVVMSGTVYIGLALSSHSANNPTTAVFSGIKTTGSVTGSWQVADIGVTHPVNAAGSVYLAVEDSAGKVATITHPDPAATTLTDWQQWTIDLATLRSAGVKVNLIKKLRLGVGNHDNAQPDGTGRLYIDDIRITKGVPVEPNAVVTP